MLERVHQYVIVEFEYGTPVKVHTIDMPVYGHQHYRNQYGSIETFRDKANDAYKKHFDKGDPAPPKRYDAMAATAFDQGPNRSGWLNEVPTAHYGNVNEFYDVIGYNKKRKLHA